MKVKIDITPITDDSKYNSATYSQIVNLGDKEIIKIIQYINNLVFEHTDYKVNPSYETISKTY